MTYDEARKLLGLEPGDGGPEARRAYLRLLKVHRPERDPEGFKRLREAFEAVQARAAGFVAEGLSPPVAVRGDAAEASPAMSPPLEDVRTRLLAVHDDAEKLRLAREAAHSDPSASGYSLWLEIADEVADEDEAREALRAGVDRGHTELREALRLRFPDALSEEELAAWHEESRRNPSASWPGLAAALLERGRVEHAVELGLSALARNVELPGVVEEWSSVDLALRLLSLEPLESPLRFARALLTRADSFASMDPLRLTLLGELTRVADRAPALVVNEIARALRAHDPGQADDTIVLFSDSDKRAGRRLQALLKSEAPALFQIYENVLLPAPVWSWKDFSVRSALRRLFTLRAGTIWPLLVAINILRMCVSSQCHTNDTRDTGPLVTGSVSISMRPLANGSEYLSCTPFNHVFCTAANGWWQAATCADRLRGAEQIERALPLVTEHLNANEKALVARIVHKTRTDCTGGAVP